MGLPVIRFPAKYDASTFSFDVPAKKVSEPPSIFPSLIKTDAGDEVGMVQRKEALDAEVIGLEATLASQRGKTAQSIRDSAAGKMPETEMPINKKNIGTLATGALLAGLLGGDPNSVAGFIQGFVQGAVPRAEAINRERAMEAETSREKRRLDAEANKFEFDAIGNELETKRRERDRIINEAATKANHYWQMGSRIINDIKDADGVKAAVQMLGAVAERYNVYAKIAGLPEITPEELYSQVQMAEERGHNLFAQAFRGNAETLNSKFNTDLNNKLNPSAAEPHIQRWNDMVKSIPADMPDVIRQSLLSLRPNFEGGIMSAALVAIPKVMDDAIDSIRDLARLGVSDPKLVADTFDSIDKVFVTRVKPWSDLLESIDADPQILASFHSAVTSSLRTHFQYSVDVSRREAFKLYEAHTRLKLAQSAAARAERESASRETRETFRMMNDLAQKDFNNRMRIMEFNFRVSQATTAPQIESLKSEIRGINAYINDQEKLLAEAERAQQNPDDNAEIFQKWGGRDSFDAMVEGIRDNIKSLRADRDSLLTDLERKAQSLVPNVYPVPPYGMMPGYGVTPQGGIAPMDPLGGGFLFTDEQREVLAKAAADAQSGPVQLTVANNDALIYDIIKEVLKHDPSLQPVIQRSGDKAFVSFAKYPPQEDLAGQFGPERQIVREMTGPDRGLGRGELEQARKAAAQKGTVSPNGYKVIPAVRKDKRGKVLADYGSVLDRHASERKLDPAIVRALVQAESNFNPAAKSPVGASGLMQLMPATAAELYRQTYGRPAPKDLTVKMRKEPNVKDEVTGLTWGELNVSLGTKYLSQKLLKYSKAVDEKGAKIDPTFQLVLALASYNAGSGAVSKYSGVPPYTETRNYVTKILRTLGVPETKIKGYLTRKFRIPSAKK